MAVTDNTQEMIDFLVYRHGLNAPSDRAMLLDMLQAEEQSVWMLHPFWFRQVQDTVQSAQGQAVYTTNAPCANILEIADEYGRPLEFVPPETFNRLYKSSAPVAGQPQVWTMLPRETHDTCQFQVWPTPSAAIDLQLVRETTFSALADSAASQSALPPQWRMVLITGVELRLMRQEGQVESAQDKQNEYNLLIQAMLAEDARQGKVRR